MADFKDICQKFDATILQQLYKKVTGDSGKLVDKNIFPIGLVQAIYDAISGMRLDDILSHYNFIHLEYKGSQESTRLAIPIGHRRNSLIITYKDYEGSTIVEQYVGDTINDNDWKNPDNWKTPFTEGKFTVNLTDEQLRLFIREYFDSHNISDIISEEARTQIINFINSDEGIALFTDLVLNFFGDRLNDFITDAKLMELMLQFVLPKMPDILNNYFATEEGQNVIRDAIQPQVEEVVGQFFEAFRAYMLDNERVIANALARHEQAITDLQN